MKVMIDVDNTLCEFSGVLNEEVQKINDKIPNHSNWNHWNFYRGFITDKEFYDAAHRAQDRILECPEVPGASEMTLLIKKYGHEIVIASHREKQNIPILQEWLENNEIEYDEIHASNDKTVLFDEGSIRLVIEDSPIIISESCRRGILTVGIKKPWNRDVQGKCLLMIDNYLDINPSIHEILAIAEE